MAFLCTTRCANYVQSTQMEVNLYIFAPFLPLKHKNPMKMSDLKPDTELMNGFIKKLF